MVEEWRRLRDFGLRIHEERRLVAQDVQKLAAKFYLVADNHAKAHSYVRSLHDHCRDLRAQIGQKQGLGLRQAEVELAEVDELVRVHSQKRHLYFHATCRIYGILRMNELFAQLLQELALQTERALHSSLDMLRYYARGEEPPAYLTGEFRQALGKLGHPYKAHLEA